MLRALMSLADTSVLDVRIDTEAEATKRYVTGSRGPTTARDLASARDFEISLDRIPAYEELRRYYTRVEDQHGGSSSVASARIDEDTRRFAAAALNRSRQALTDAWALKRHVEEITSGQLSALDPERQARFRSMIADHAASLRQELRRLRAELQPVFMPAGRNLETFGLVDQSSGERDVERILQLTSTIDEEIRRAFAFSVEGSDALQIQTERFWRSLELAEQLAGRVKDR
jgi:hypothetical protein